MLVCAGIYLNWLYGNATPDLTETLNADKIMDDATFVLSPEEGEDVQAVLQGLKPCVIGIILATGIHMILRNCLGAAAGLNHRAVFITIVLLGIKFLYQHVQKKKLNPILLILISAFAGIGFYGV